MEAPVPFDVEVEPPSSDARVPRVLDERLGLRRTWVDKLESRVHTTIWKLIPVGLSRQTGPVYFALCQRLWNPSRAPATHARGSPNAGGSSKPP